MDTFCPTLSGDPAVEFVEGGYDRFMTLGQKTYDAALELMQQLGATLITPIDFVASFDFTDQLTPIVRPPVPSIDDAQFEFRDPGGVPAPPTFTPRDVLLDDAPVDTSTVPTLHFGPAPSTPVIPVPIAPTRPPALVVPAPPDYVIPALPTLRDLNLPDPPDIQMPTFQGDRPDFVEPPLGEEFWQFNPDTYASELLARLKSKLLTDLDGGTGLPVSIERALFDRGRGQIVIETERAIEAVVDDFASRGFTEPNGILNAKVLSARQDALNKTATLNRDLTIQFHNEQLVNLRFAVTSGIALEGVTVNLFVQELQIQLQAAQYARETSIALLNARIAVFNARLAAYQTDAQIFQSLIQAEIAKAELYRDQIAAQQLIGEINQQTVALYTAQLQGIQALATFYTAQVEGVKAQADVNRAIIESFTAEVQAFTAQWQGFATEVEAYKAIVETQNIKAQVSKTQVDRFGVLVSAWDTQQRTKFEQERLRITDNGQRLDAWKAILSLNQERLETERARLQAVAAGADSKTRLYAAKAGVEQAVSAANDRAFELLLEAARAEVDIQLKAAEIRIQENIQIQTLDVDVRRSLAQIMSQLAASINSAMSFSAGVSSSKSDGKSCSTSVSYSGDAPDLGS